MLMQPHGGTRLDFIQVRAANGASERGGLRATARIICVHSHNLSPRRDLAIGMDWSPREVKLPSAAALSSTSTCSFCQYSQPQSFCALLPSTSLSTPHPSTHIHAPPSMHQNMEYKFVELLSCRFQASPEDVVRQQVSAQFLSIGGRGRSV